MGKGKRLKAERQLALAENAGRAPLHMLAEAVLAIGDLFGTNADCATAAAMLKLTAGHLGYELSPRPVSLVAMQPSTGNVAFMGPKATSLVPESDRDRVENHLPEGKDNGHMVLTSEDPALLLDPNLRQLGAFGMQAPSLVIRIQSTEPSSGEWFAELDDLELQYILDEANPALSQWYNDGLVQHADRSRQLATLLRSGAKAHQLRLG